jgi:hypothetical protein
MFKEIEINNLLGSGGVSLSTGRDKIHSTTIWLYFTFQ